MGERPKRCGVMLATKYKPSLIEGWEMAYYQPKVDGFRCRVWCNRGEIILYSSTGAEINTAPTLIRKLMKLSAVFGMGYFCLDGELIVPGETFNGISSIIKRNKPHSREDEICYLVFDIIGIMDPAVQLNQKQRMDLLSVLSSIIAIESSQEKTAEINHNIRTLGAFLQPASDKIVGTFMMQFIEEGWEGVILRRPDGFYEASAPKRSKNLLKLKPTESGWFEVTGYTQLYSSTESKPQDMVGSFICRTASGERFTVGTGPYFTKVQRAELWKAVNMVGLPALPAAVHVRYQELTERGVPRFPVATEATYVSGKA